MRFLIYLIFLVYFLSSYNSIFALSLPEALPSFPTETLDIMSDISILTTLFQLHSLLHKTIILT